MVVYRVIDFRNRGDDWLPRGNPNYVQNGGMIKYVLDANGFTYQKASVPDIPPNVTRRAEGATWGLNNLDEFYIGFGIKFPPYWKVLNDKDHTTICQLHVNNQSPYSHYASLVALTGNRLSIKRNWGYKDEYGWIHKERQTLWTSEPDFIELDRDIEVVCYLKTGVDGEFTLNWDGVTVLRFYGDMDSLIYDKFATIHAGLYCGSTDEGAHTIFHREIRVADNFQEARPSPYEPDPEPDPEPPIIKRGCVLAFLCSSMGLSTLLPWIRAFRSHLPKSMIRAYYGVSGFVLRGVS